MIVFILVAFLWITCIIALITRSPKAWIATGLTCVALSCVDVWRHETFMVFYWLFLAALCMNSGRERTVE